MEGDSKAAVGCTLVSAGAAFGSNLFSKKKSGNAVGAAGPPLAVQAVAEGDLLRFTDAGDPKLPAGARCRPVRHGNSQLFESRYCRRPAEPAKAAGREQ